MNDWAAGIIATADQIAADAKRGTTHEDHVGWSFSSDQGTPFRCGCGEILIDPNKEGV
ncbi:hypothetical protein SEA_MARGARET_47 [Gordonia phage Margaret]|nr:hypothetical protein SEA_MARGARET_47 [Gordonia phage Margaret]